VRAEVLANPGDALRVGHSSSVTLERKRSVGNPCLEDFLGSPIVPELSPTLVIARLGSQIPSAHHVDDVLLVGGSSHGWTWLGSKTSAIRENRLFVIARS